MEQILPRVMREENTYNIGFRTLSYAENRVTLRISWLITRAIKQGLKRSAISIDIFI